MKRPLLLFSLALISGVFAAQAVGFYCFIFISILMAAAVSIVFFRKYKADLFILIGLLLFYFIGAFEYMCVAYAGKDRFIEFSGEQVSVRGFVCKEPDVRDSKIAYTLKVSEISESKGTERISGKILLTVIRNSESVIYEYGSRIEVRGQLNIPKGKRAPGGFDYRSYLARSGISATVFAKNEDIILMQGKGGNALVRTGLGLRSKIVGVIEKSLPKEQASLLNGMLIGYTSGMSEKTADAFSDSGLSHITAVSGMNVAFLVFPLIFLFKKLRMGQKTANFIIIGILVLFLFVTGFSPSVARAVIMAVIMLAGQIIKRETDVITSISFAAILLIICNPYTLFDIGFQLSFAATLSLILFYKYLKGILTSKFIPGLVSDIVAATLAAQIGTLPISAFYFNKISIISLATNLVVVPLVEIVTIIGAVMAVAGQFSVVLSQILGYLNCTFLTFILYVVKIASDLPFAVIKIITPSVFFIFLYYVSALFFLWLRPLYKIKLKMKYYFAAFGIAIFLVVFNALIPGNLEVVFIDVGQGDSALIRTSSGKTVLIDGGGFSSVTDTEHNMGDYVIIPFLLDYGISKLDLVIASHAHDDHIQGLRSVLKDFKVGSIIIPDVEAGKDFDKILDIAALKAIPYRMCGEGERIKLDSGTFLKVLYPADEVKIDTTNLNNTSLVLKLCYRNTSVLFTGDIEEDVENILVEEGADIKADVLKVAHHGSETSSTESFLEAVSPRAAVISVGKNNFGHPSERVLERLEKGNVYLFRTDMDGTIIMTSDGSKIRFKKTVEN